MWSTDFIALSNEQRLLALSLINDKVRSLRRGIIAAQNAETAINLSTRTFASGWQGTLITDIDQGTEGQDPGIKELAEALEAPFIA